MNERRDIVGIYLIANTPDECYGSPNFYAFLLRQGKYTTIHVPGSIATRALAINDDGKIVGDYSDTSGNHGYTAVPVQ